MVRGSDQEAEGRIRVEAAQAAQGEYESGEDLLSGENGMQPRPPLQASALQGKEKVREKVFSVSHLPPSLDFFIIPSPPPAPFSFSFQSFLIF